MTFVQELHKKKEYRVETMHLACHLIDRYLAFLIRGHKYNEMPNLYHLSATCLLIAAKLEQPMQPSFNKMIDLLPNLERRKTSKEDLIALEKKVIVALDFDLQFVSPLCFMDRYQRVFGID